MWRSISIFITALIICDVQGKIEDDCSCTDTACFADPCQVKQDVCDIKGSTCVSTFCGGCHHHYIYPNGTRIHWKICTDTCRQPPYQDEWGVQTPA